MSADKKLKIAQLSPYYHPSIGGVESVVKNISEQLVARGHTVDVLTSTRDHGKNLNLPEKEFINGVNVHRFKNIFQIGHMSLMPSLCKHLNKNEYDIIHSHGYRHPHSEMALFIGHKKRTPVILHGHSPFMNSDILTIKQKIAYSIYDLYASLISLNKYDSIFCLTDFEREKYHWLGAHDSKTQLVPNAIKMDCNNLKSNILEKHDLVGKRLILFMGNLNFVKRADLLLEAMPQVLKKVPNAVAVLAGNDEGENQLIKNTAKRLKIEKFYKWVGPVYNNDKQALLNAAELFVLPSDHDSFPVVLLEAMSFSKPIIATDTNGGKSIIENEINGLLVSRGNVDELARAIIRLLQNEELRNKLGKNAFEIAKQKYDIKIVTDKIESTYYNLKKVKRQ